MKQQKRILEHLMEQGKEESPYQISFNQPPQNSRTTVDFDPVYDFQVLVDIGDGRTDTIFMNESSDPQKQAQSFCNKHNLDPYIVQLLAQSLTSQAKQQRQSVKHSFNQAPASLPQRIMETQKSTTHPMKSSTTCRMPFWKKDEQETLRPKINNVSQEIVRKVGKQALIEAASRKFENKLQEHINQHTQIQAKQMESYSFHPTINPISEKVDRTLHQSRNQKKSRFDKLYGEHKMIENKKEELRRNSLSILTFQPSINHVSRNIIDKKRSLGQICPIEKRPKVTSKVNSNEKNSRASKAKRDKILNASTELGHHLYDEAKRRKEKLQQEADKIYNQNDNWQIIQSSNAMVNEARQIRIREVFHNLAEDSVLDYRWIDEDRLSEVERIFLPVFKEMKEMRIQLTEEQFLDAGLRLLKYLSPHERGLLVKKSHPKGSCEKENKSIMNSKSKQIIGKKGYGDVNIYVRGVLFKREVKDQVQKCKEEKVRRELQDCTFKPKINGVPDNIAY